MMRYLIFISINLFLIQSSLLSQRFILDKPIGVIGNEVTLYSEIEEQYSLFDDRGVATDNTRCEILESMLVSSLLTHHARIDSVEVTEDEVEAQLDTRINRILSMMGNDLEQFEAYYGMSITDAKNLNREDLEKKLLAERMQARIMENITVTPAEVIDFFNKIHPDSLPFFNSEVELGEIIYNPMVNEEERTKALETINGILERIHAGEDFAVLARNYSDDAGSSQQGGDLGRNGRGTFVAEFEAAAFNLEVGDISPVVETQFGFHIIQLMERLGNLITTRHILIKPEIKDKDLDLARNHLLEVREKIMNDSLPFIQAVKEYSDTESQSYSNSGRMVNPKSGNTFFETGDLDPDVFFAIDTIDIGELTGPVEFRSPRGDVFYKIIQLQSRTAPHKASLRQDYSKIQTAAKESKKNSIFNEWIEDKIKDTYILVDAVYHGCQNMEKWQVRTIKP
jgi:peptidyl-prolyl cis-trans isomerase SurA